MRASRVIFMSGYSEHAAAEAAQAGSSVRILTKPFNRGALLRAVREVLGVCQKVLHSSSAGSFLPVSSFRVVFPCLCPCGA